MDGTDEYDLVPFTAADVALLRSWIDSREALVEWAGTRYAWPLREADMVAHFERSLAQVSDCAPFKYVGRKERSMVGYVEINRIDRDNRNAALSRVIVAPDSRGSGLSRGMLSAALDVGFQELLLHRIELSVYAHNTPAIRCYARMGFVEEGRLRELTRVGDVYWDEIRMSLLEREWRERARPASEER